MAREPFLINPYRVNRRKSRVKSTTRSTRRRRSGGLPSQLLSRMIRQYGPRRGMKEAWAAYRGGVKRNAWPGQASRHRRASNVGWSQRSTGISGYAHTSGAKYKRYKNPLGEEVMIVGANPRKRRRKATSRKRRVMYMSNARRVRRRKRRAVFFDNPRQRRYSRRRRAMYFDNPRRRRYSQRRFRRNPARRAAVGLPAFSFKKPLTILMPAVIGTAAYIATEKIPSMVNVTDTLPRLGVKVAVGFGGGILISRFLGKQNAAIWTIGSSINILSDILRTYVFKTGGLLGLGAFPYQTYQGLGAYPYQTQEYAGYDGLGAYALDQGAGYPM